MCLRPQSEQQLRCSSVRPMAPLLHALPISRPFDGNANFRTWSAGSCTLPSSCLVLYGLHNRLECTRQPRLYICRPRMRGALQASVASCLVSPGGARSDRPVTHVSPLPQNLVNHSNLHITTSAVRCFEKPEIGLCTILQSVAELCQWYFKWS